MKTFKEIAKERLSRVAEDFIGEKDELIEYALSEAVFDYEVKEAFEHNDIFEVLGKIQKYHENNYGSIQIDLGDKFSIYNEALRIEMEELS